MIIQFTLHCCRQALSSLFCWAIPLLKQQWWQKEFLLPHPSKIQFSFLFWKLYQRPPEVLLSQSLSLSVDQYQLWMIPHLYNPRTTKSEACCLIMFCILKKKQKKNYLLICLEPFQRLQRSLGKTYQPWEIRSGKMK